MITTIGELYGFVDSLAEACRRRGHHDIAQQLNDAMHLGSSGLEILGAIKIVLVSQAPRLKSFVDERRIQEVVEYVNRTYGAT